MHAAELAQRFGVSLDTVRRDLQELADAGALRRVHGGALPASPGAVRFVDRRHDDVAAKSAIAAAAVGLIRPGEVVALSGGTTVLELAQRLPDDLAATVITTSPDMASAKALIPRSAALIRYLRVRSCAPSPACAVRFTHLGASRLSRI